MCLGVNFRPSRLRTPTKGRLTRAIMECGQDAPAPQSNENMTSWLSRCVENAGSSTANEGLWEDHPDDLQDEGDEEIARLAMEWRRDNAAAFDKNYSWQPSVKVDRCAGDRWNVWHHDGDGKWAHSVALRMSNGVGLGQHELTFAEYDARVVANTMSEESQTTQCPKSASVLGWNRLEKHLLLKILLCLGPDALWDSGNVCRSWMPLALTSFRTRFGPTKYVAELTREDGLSQFQKEVATQLSFEEHNATSTGGGASEYKAHREAVVRGIRAGFLGTSSSDLQAMLQARAPGTSSSANIPCASHTDGVLGFSLPVAHTLPVASATSSSSSQRGKLCCLYVVVC